jgi:hypothetical protein
MQRCWHDIDGGLSIHRLGDGVSAEKLGEYSPSCTFLTFDRLSFPEHYLFKGLSRFLLECAPMLETWFPSIYKMTINKKVGLVIQKLIPNSSHKNLSLDFTPLQDSGTVTKTDWLN